MQYKIFTTIALCFICFITVFAQTELYGISTVWDDSFKEWEIYTEDKEVIGDLTATWADNDDWSEWEYRIGEETGSIRQKWKDNPREWELRGDNEVITMSAKWANDFTEWYIRDGEHVLTLKSKYRNDLSQWELTSKDEGKFSMNTSYEYDVRDWDIWDELADSISLPTKVAITFIVAYHSSPKR